MNLTTMLPGAGDSDEAREMKMAMMARNLFSFFEAMNRFEPQHLYDGSGLVLQVLGRRVGRDFNIGFPFQCFDAGSRPADKITTVNLHSHLLKSIKPNDNLEVVGLDYPFSIDAGQKIWLDIVIEDHVAKSSSVKHGTQWDGYPEPVKFTGQYPTRKQTNAYVLIAYAVKNDENYQYDPPGVVLGSGGSAITVINIVRTHMLMAETCYNGENILYPVPWWGAFINR
jgi:hypothetical protein